MGMIRAEQMLDLGAGIALDKEGNTLRISNRTRLDLRDATLVMFGSDGEAIEVPIGSVAGGSSVVVRLIPNGRAISTRVEGFNGPDPSRLLALLRSQHDPSPVNNGEVRLVAWLATPIEGMTFAPDLDRRRGVTVVVAHLRRGPPPDPSGPRYNVLANGPEPTTLPIKESDLKPPETESPQGGTGSNR
jgi:hypothetical protein